MSILPNLIKVFEVEGFSIRTGLNPSHFGNHKEAPFTIPYKDGQVFSGYGGIALQEVMLIELLCAELKPQNIYVIGNAWGWSTIAFAMAAPGAQVIAVDPEMDEGRELTELIIKKEGLNASTLKGASPEITAQAAERFNGNKFDLVFVDGQHENEFMMADTHAAMPHMSNSGVILYHDIITTNLIVGFEKLVDIYGGQFDPMLLERTPSGMGLLTAKSTPECVKVIMNVFHDPVAGIDFKRSARLVAGTETNDTQLKWK